MKTIEQNTSIIKGAGWTVEEIPMEPSIEAPVACEVEGDFFCNVKQIPEFTAYTVVITKGRDRDGKVKRLANAYNRMHPDSSRFRAACYEAHRLGLEELFA